MMHFPAGIFARLFVIPQGSAFRSVENDSMRSRNLSIYLSIFSVTVISTLLSNELIALVPDLCSSLCAQIS